MVMNKKDLKENFYMYGNKGACWSNNVHIAENCGSTTLCGTPMLATNQARIWEHENIECEKCLNEYNKKI